MRISNGWWKWGVGILVLLVVAFFSLQYFLADIIKERLTAAIQSAVHKQLGEHYTVTYDDLSFSLFHRKATYTGFNITPDTSGFHHLDSTAGLTRDQLFIEMDHLRFRGIHLWDAYANEKTIVNNIYASEPEFVVVHYPHLGRNRSDSGASADKELLIKEVNIQNGRFALYSFAEEKDSVLIPLFNFTITDLSNRPAIGGNPKSTLSFRNFNGVLTSFEFKQLGNGLNLKTGNISFNSKSSRVSIDSLRITPVTDKYGYAARLGYQSTWTEHLIPGIKIKGIALSELLLNKELDVRKIDIHHWRIAAYQDKRYPQKPGKKVLMPQDYLRELPLRVRIDTIVVRQSYITYEEYNPRATASGKVTFADFNVKATNVTNYPELLAENIKARVDGDFLLMGAGRFYASIVMPLGDTLNGHSFSGGIGPMALAEFNPACRAMGLMDIKSGKMQSGTFKGWANNYEGKGEVTAKYTGLKINLLETAYASEEKANKEEKEGLLKRIFKGKEDSKKNVASILANLFVIKESNPDGPKKPLRTEPMIYQRDPSRFIFHYWWHMLADGITRLIGVHKFYTKGSS